MSVYGCGDDARTLRPAPTSHRASIPPRMVSLASINPAQQDVSRARSQPAPGCKKSFASVRQTGNKDMGMATTDRAHMLLISNSLKFPIDVSTNEPTAITAKLSQKIIVPKGTIDPRDDTIIEIPPSLQSQEIVIAKKTHERTASPYFTDSCQSACPSTLVNKSCADAGFTFPPPAAYSAPPSPEFSVPSPVSLDYKMPSQRSVPFFSEPCQIPCSPGVITNPCAYPVPPSVRFPSNVSSRTSERNLPFLIEQCQNPCPPPIMNRSYLDTAFIIPPSNRYPLNPVNYVTKSQQTENLDEAELIEQQVVLNQLEEFQRARRRFLVDASKVACRPSTSNLVRDVGTTSSSRAARDISEVARINYLTSGTQTSILQPISRARDSLALSRTRSLHKPRVSMRNLHDEAFYSLDSEEDEEAFKPAYSSTGLVMKKDSFVCEICLNKALHDSSDLRGRRGHIPPILKKSTSSTMDRVSSRASEVSKDSSSRQSCLSTDCDFGSKKSDQLCAPCCNPKSPERLNDNRRINLTDNDFQKIKEQLREARKKLDEAVALVRNVASSSSMYASGAVSPWSNTSPTSSYIGGEIPYKKVSSRMMPKPERDSKYCPLRDMVNTNEQPRSWVNRSKSTTDNLLCLDACSNMKTPNCVSDEASKSRPLEPRSFPVGRTSSKPSPSIPCAPMLPCDIPSATSAQDPMRQAVMSARSLPTSSTRMDGSQGRSNYKQPTETSKPPDYRSYEDDRKKPDMVRGPNQCKNDTNALCSSVCLNMDLPPCASEDILKKQAELLQNFLRMLSTKPNATVVSTAPQPVSEISPIVKQESELSFVRESSSLIIKVTQGTSTSFPQPSEDVNECSELNRNIKEYSSTGIMKDNSKPIQEKKKGGICGIFRSKSKPREEKGGSLKFDENVEKFKENPKASEDKDVQQIESSSKQVIPKPSKLSKTSSKSSEGKGGYKKYEENIQRETSSGRFNPNPMPSEDQNGYLKFKEKIPDKHSTDMFKADQVNHATSTDFSNVVCFNPTSTPNRVEVQQMSSRNPNISGIPCSPIYPCDLPRLQQEQSRTNPPARWIPADYQETRKVAVEPKPRKAEENLKNVEDTKSPNIIYLERSYSEKIAKVNKDDEKLQGVGKNVSDVRSPSKSGGKRGKNININTCTQTIETTITVSKSDDESSDTLMELVNTVLMNPDADESLSATLTYNKSKK